MRGFADLPIQGKLLVSALIGVALTAAVGVTGYAGIERVWAGSAELLHGDARIAELATEVEIGVLQARRWEKNLFLRMGDAKQMTESEQKLWEQKRRIEQQLDALQTLARAPSDKLHLSRLHTALEGYAAGMQGVVAQIRSGALSDPQQADRAIAPFRSVARELDETSGQFAQEARARMPAAEQRLAALARQVGLWMAAIVGVAVLCGLGLSWIVSRAISRPLRRAVIMLEDLARGEGDLGTRLEVHAQDEIGALASAFNTFVGKLHDIVTHVKRSSDALSTAAEELAGSAGRLSSGAQEQAASLEETAASLEQMTATVKLNASNASQANELASEAKTDAERGGAIVGEAVAAMQAITSSSKRIQAIITTIDEIALQTNLLALNAAVEAARAGDQGRGFAVVASEVRALAERSAAAAKEISSLLSDSLNQVTDEAKLVTQAGGALSQIVSEVNRTAELIAAIAAASGEQSTGISQVNQAVSQIDAVTQQNAAQTAELSDTAKVIAAQAADLSEQFGHFRLRGEPANDVSQGESARGRAAASL